MFHLFSRIVPHKRLCDLLMFTRFYSIFIIDECNHTVLAGFFLVIFFGDAKNKHKIALVSVFFSHFFLLFLSLSPTMPNNINKFFLKNERKVEKTEIRMAWTEKSASHMILD